MERQKQPDQPNDETGQSSETTVKEPEPFPPELLNEPASVRQNYFEKLYILEHARLLDACDTVLRHICPPDNDPDYRRKAKMVLVIGPPQVGKTTLIGLLKEALLRRAQKRMIEDPGYMPFVSITLEAKGRLNWSRYYLAILEALGDPFLKSRSRATETELQRAGEKALLHRGVEVIIVDEAQHLAKASRGSTQQDQLDQLKYFENKLHVSHVLVGTYEMRPFRKVNAQLACRTVDVHFSRYDARNETDRALFQSAVWAFQRQLPVPKEPPLVQKHWLYLYARSLGCIGILKRHLNDALALALQEGANTVTKKHLTRTALAKDKLDLELTVILKGETDLANAEPKDADRLLLIDLGLMAPPKPARQQGEQPKGAKDQQPDGAAPSGSAQKRLPGEQNPKRLPIGVSVEGKEETELEPDEEEAAG